MKDILIISVVTTALISFLELGAYFHLKKTSDHRPLFFTQYNYNRVPDRDIYRSIDPLLGWTIAGKSYPGYHVMSGRSDLAGSPRIMILGGSTTDQHYLDHSWVENLFQNLRKIHPELIIFNGGVAGYTSSQEALKLMRDIDVLKPTHIVVYDGVNEDKFFTVQDHPYISEHIVKVLKQRFPFFPNLLELMAGTIPFNMGPVNPQSSPERWFLNHQKMHAIAQSKKISYLGILQPHIWSGSYKKDEREKEQVTEFFKENYQTFYQVALPLVKETEFLYDGTHFLDQLNGVYIDDCHLYPDGQKMIAHQIELLLRERL